MEPIIYKIKRGIVYTGAIFASIFVMIKRIFIFPILAPIAVIFTAYIFLFPESVVAFFYFGRPLFKAILFTQRDSIVFALSLFILAVSAIGIWRKYKRFVLPANLFTIGSVVLIIWALTCLMWISNPMIPLRNSLIWTFEIMVPMFFAYILTLHGLRIRNLTDHLIILSIIMLSISAGYKIMHIEMPFDRFSPVSNKVLYSRVMAFVFMFSIWLYDKPFYSTKVKTIFALLGICGLYFLVLSATRAPFVFAVMLISLYILFVSRLTRRTKLIIWGISIVFAFIFLRNSFLMMRISVLSVRKGLEVSSAFRAIVWETALRHLKDVPLYGLGPGEFKRFMPQYLKYLIQPHCNILGFYYETGLPGLILFLVLMGSIFLASLKLYLKLRKVPPSDAFYLLDFALLFWTFGMLNNLINDSFGGGTFEWMSLGIMQGVYDYWYHGRKNSNNIR